jgi:hypothetical protein
MSAVIARDALLLAREEHRNVSRPPLPDPEGLSRPLEVRRSLR